MFGTSRQSKGAVNFLLVPLDTLLLNAPGGSSKFLRPAEFTKPLPFVTSSSSPFPAFSLKNGFRHQVDAARDALGIENWKRETDKTTPINMDKADAIPVFRATKERASRLAATHEISEAFRNSFGQFRDGELAEIVIRGNEDFKGRTDVEKVCRRSLHTRI